jgi:signal transduction histidine kinase
MVVKGCDSVILDDSAEGVPPAPRRHGQQPGLDAGEGTPLPPQANLFRSDVLTHLSHEMCTPLSAILGFAQLLDSGTPSLTISQKRSIDRILQAGWYLEKLISMTRDLALIEAGTLSLSLEPVPLAAIMLECQAMIESQAQMRGVRVTLPVFETSLSVTADRFRLKDVLGNLFAAAIEGSDVDGSVVVNYDTRNSEWVRIDINYDGKRFSAGQPTPHRQPTDGLERRATAVDGRGLGVLLAERLVESMGGAIAGEGSDGGRKAFRVDLKRMPVAVECGHATTHSIVGEAEIPRGRQPQSPIHAPQVHGHDNNAR